MKYEYLLKKNIKIYPRVQGFEFKIIIDRNGQLITSNRTYINPKVLNKAIESAVDYEYNRQMVIKEYEGAIDKRMQTISNKTNTPLNLVNRFISDYLKNKI